MYEAETQIIAQFFLGSARIFLGFGSTKIRLYSAKLFYGSAFAAPASAYRSISSGVWGGAPAKIEFGTF